MSVLVTSIILLIITGDLPFAATVGVVDAVLKFLLYFMHEWCWTKTEFGTRKERSLKKKLKNSLQTALDPVKIQQARDKYK